MWPGIGLEGKTLSLHAGHNNYFCHKDGGWVNELLRVILRATCGSPLPEKEIPKTVREYRSGRQALSKATISRDCPVNFRLRLALSRLELISPKPALATLTRDHGPHALR